MRHWFRRQLRLQSGVQHGEPSCLNSLRCVIQELAGRFDLSEQYAKDVFPGRALSRVASGARKAPGLGVLPDRCYAMGWCRKPVRVLGPFSFARCPCRSDAAANAEPNGPLHVFYTLPLCSMMTLCSCMSPN